MRIKTPVSVTIASSPHPRMAEPLSHPLDPLGARVLVPAGRPGVPAPFALRRASTIGLRFRLVGGRRNPLTPARSTKVLRKPGDVETSGLGPSSLA